MESNKIYHILDPLDPVSTNSSKLITFVVFQSYNVDTDEFLLGMIQNPDRQLTIECVGPDLGGAA